MDLADLLVLPDRRPLGRLLPARGLRLRRRHAAAVPARVGRASAATHVRDDRAGLGRQRGLARRRRRRDLRRLPGLVRDDVLGLLPRAAAHPRLPDRPRASRSSGARRARRPRWRAVVDVGEHDRELRRVADLGRSGSSNLLYGVPIDSERRLHRQPSGISSARTRVLAGRRGRARSSRSTARPS